MDTPDRRTILAPHAPPRRRRPRRYLSPVALSPDPHSPPPASAAPLSLLHRVLSGLHALPDAPPAPPSSSAPVPGAATLADLTRRLLARDPSLGAPPEEREPSPDVVVTRELPVVSAQGSAQGLAQGSAQRSAQGGAR